MMQMLSDENLQKLNTRRLLAVLKAARAVESSILNTAGPRCCTLCNEYVGSDFEADVLVHSKPFKDYKDRIKAILSTRENVE